MLTSWSLDWSGSRVSVLRGEEQVAEVASFAVTPHLELNLRLLAVGERDLRVALVLPTGTGPATVRCRCCTTRTAGRTPNAR